jgi:hypothetical protein
VSIIVASRMQFGGCVLAPHSLTHPAGRTPCVTWRRRTGQTHRRQHLVAARSKTHTHTLSLC